MPVWTCGKCGTINTTPTRLLGSDGHALCRSCGEKMFIPRPEQTVSS